MEPFDPAIVALQPGTGSIGHGKRCFSVRKPIKRENPVTHHFPDYNGTFDPAIVALQPGTGSIGHGKRCFSVRKPSKRENPVTHHLPDYNRTF
jgi:hypothetical protein